jgi:hypothetical protein
MNEFKKSDKDLNMEKKEEKQKEETKHHSSSANKYKSGFE